MRETGEFEQGSNGSLSFLTTHSISDSLNCPYVINVKMADNSILIKEPDDVGRKQIASASLL